MDVLTSDAHPWDQMNPALPKFGDVIPINNGCHMRIGIIVAEDGRDTARLLAKRGHQVSIRRPREARRA